MRKSFKDSLKALEADIQHANTLLKYANVLQIKEPSPRFHGPFVFCNIILFHVITILLDFFKDLNRASDYRREYDGASLQMRLSYSPAAHLFLFLVQWADCHFAGQLGLLRILIYKVYVDGKTTMSVYERKATVKEFYGIIFPSLIQLQTGITDVEDKKQKEICLRKYLRKKHEEKGKLSELDLEREEECGICLEMNSKVVLPNCCHALCLKCYRDWRVRSQSCPFCRDSLKDVNSADLWVYTDNREILDINAITKENLKRLFMYIDKLPLIVSGSVYNQYSSRG